MSTSPVRSAQLQGVSKSIVNLNPKCANFNLQKKILTIGFFRRVFPLLDTMVVQHFVKCEGSTYCMENLQTAAQVLCLKYTLFTSFGWQTNLLICSIANKKIYNEDTGNLTTHMDPILKQVPVVTLPYSQFALFRLWEKWNSYWACRTGYLGRLSKMAGDQLEGASVW